MKFYEVLLISDSFCFRPLMIALLYDCLLYEKQGRANVLAGIISIKTSFCRFYYAKQEVILSNHCQSRASANLIIMSTRFSDILFQLVHSLEKSEKRHFKLYIKRSSAKEDLKIIQLFDALDKMKEYDELILLKKFRALQNPVGQFKESFVQTTVASFVVENI